MRNKDTLQIRFKYKKGICSYDSLHARKYDILEEEKVLIHIENYNEFLELVNWWFWILRWFTNMNSQMILNGLIINQNCSVEYKREFYYKEKLLTDYTEG